MEPGTPDGTFLTNAIVGRMLVAIPPAGCAVPGIARSRTAASATSNPAGRNLFAHLELAFIRCPPPSFTTRLVFTVDSASLTRFAREFGTISRAARSFEESQDTLRRRALGPRKFERREPRGPAVQAAIP